METGRGAEVATIANRCVSMLPSTHLMNMYGATEASCTVCLPELIETLKF